MFTLAFYPAQATFYPRHFIQAILILRQLQIHDFWMSGRTPDFRARSLTRESDPLARIIGFLPVFLDWLFVFLAWITDGKEFWSTYFRALDSTDSDLKTWYS